MLLGQHCSMLSTILFGIVTPDCGLIQAQQYCSILLTTRNNVAPTILLHPVFNNLLQLIIFCRVHGQKSEAVENRMQQCCWGNIVQCCQQYCSALLHLIAG